MSTPRRTLTAILLIAALIAVACGDATGTTGDAAPPSPAGTAKGGGLSVAVASFDLATGSDRRFIAGVFTDDRQVIGFGQVQMGFFYLGEEDAGGQPEPLSRATATFLPVPGKEPKGDSTGPVPLDDPQTAGVYETTVDLARPGFYGVAVSAEIDGERRSGTASFQVAEQHQVPAVGDPAPATTNLTVDSDAPPAAIDSRAATDGDIPDPHLHDTSVADAIDQNRPVVVVLSTPVYCVSRFCGPITETIADLANAYNERVEFVHLEVWRDFDAGELNAAAAEWIQTPEGGNEPWVFLIGADGRIAARWDNVLDRADLEQRLDTLPPTDT